MNIAPEGPDEPDIQAGRVHAPSRVVALYRQLTPCCWA
jgi:hypothetical protein